ncbi:DUF4377 domain-containing protein [Pseudotamlana agarivorans]|uniref:DUF4377 domain-containing protein n=1 Tax=Pseudotamlana agarivorans TaxID=481183 RepID=UPI0008355984|nr:DUF4377 domain-containing protein [Tamlana agarivorans]
MKLIKTISTVILLTILSTSCSSNDTENTSFWVNSMKADCDAGAGKAQCLQIYKGEDIENAEWTYFYSTIEGFNFEPGLLQKLEVSETHLEAKDVPADASSIKYKLVKVLEKKADPRMILNDIWAATHIEGNAIETDNIDVPYIEINIAKLMISGTDGCNNFSGSIKKLNTNTIALGPIAMTRKMCPNMEVPDRFSKALTLSTTYKRDGLTLYFYDSEGHETLRFNKAD